MEDTANTKENVSKSVRKCNKCIGNNKKVMENNIKKMEIK